MKDIKIALVVMNCPVGKTSDNLDRLAGMVRATAQKGAEVICFPELNISGYSTRNDPGLTAEPIPGPASEILCKLAGEEKVTILAGLAEKDSQDRIFATHMVIAPDRLAGIYRKVHIAPPEVSIFSSGNKVPLFEINGCRFGIQLCYDTHFPELTTLMALKGADLVFMPHASPRGTPEGKLNSWMRHLTARAFDNGVFVAACNQTGSNDKGLDFPGMAVVIGPSGDLLYSRIDGQEGFLMAVLKADTLEQVRKHKMRYFLPHRRPEIYRLSD